MASAETVRGLGGGGTGPGVGHADRKFIGVIFERDVHTTAFVERPRMPDGIGDQLVYDERERHGYVGRDDNRMGIDDKRPRPIRAARCSRNLLTEIDEVAVERNCPISSYL